MVERRIRRRRAASPRRRRALATSGKAGARGRRKQVAAGSTSFRIRGVTSQPPKRIRTRVQPAKIFKRRKAGQRFTPVGVKQRRKVKAIRSKIRRTNTLSRTRSVDVRNVSEGGFRIFAPRNTPPAFTVEGSEFTQNRRTRPVNLNQLQIRQKQVRQFKGGELPRQRIDKAVGQAGDFAFNIGTELFSRGGGILSNIEDFSNRRAEEKAQGVPRIQSERRREAFDLFKIEAGRTIKTRGTSGGIFALL